MGLLQIRRYMMGYIIYWIKNVREILNSQKLRLPLIKIIRLLIILNLFYEFLCIKFKPLAN